MYIRYLNYFFINYLKSIISLTETYIDRIKRLKIKKLKVLKLHEKYIITIIILKDDNKDAKFIVDYILLINFKQGFVGNC